MNLFSRYFAQVRTQIVNLTMSQRLTIGLLVVVLIGTIYMVVLNSAKPEMDELLPGTHCSPEEVSTMTSFLKGKYTYQVQGDKVLVPAEQAYQIRGELAAAQVLPKNTTVAFAKLADANDWMLPEASIERKWNFARQEVLAKVLRNFPYIADATVIISKGERAGLGRDAVPSSAMVNVRLKSGEALANNQVMAIVETVQGAIAGMTRDQVHVTDGNRSYTLPNENIPMATGLEDAKRNMERALTEKLVGQLEVFIPNVRVAVNVVPDWSSRTRMQHTPNKDSTVSATVRETSVDSNTSDGAGGGQPGVVPNTAMATGGGGSKSSSSSSNSQTEKKVDIGVVEEHSSTMPGAEIKKLTASIIVPRSYLVAIYRRTAKDAKAEPDDGVIDGVFRGQVAPVGAAAPAGGALDVDPRKAETILEKTRLAAMNAIGAEKPEQVHVAWFDDAAAPPVMAGTGGGSGGLLASAGPGGYGSLISQHGKTVVLGTLTLGVVMMMLMMIRKATPAAEGVEADAGSFLGFSGGKKNKKDPHALDVDDDVIGEAGAGEAVLTGIELDDETLASRKMVDEVSAMIKENPENAASLVKRWMTKNK